MKTPLSYLTLLSLTSLIQIGCASMSGPYSQTTMVQIQHKRNYEPIEAKEFLAEDKYISIKYTPDIVEAGISVQINNKSPKVVKIIWDESAYISPDKQSQKIFHSGIKIADRSLPQPVSVIPPQGMIQDSLLPINSVTWDAGGWRYSPLCGVRSLVQHTLDDSLCVNSAFSFFITYEVDGKKNNLTLKYKFIGKEALEKKK